MIRDRDHMALEITPREIRAALAAIALGCAIAATASTAITRAATARLDAQEAAR